MDSTQTDLMAKVIAAGDLARLTPQERSTYYLAVCESVGLNPMTEPLKYLTLNGRLTLYAGKGATDQLRSMHGISIRVTGQDVMDDLYVVTVEGTDKAGRTDSEVGAVVISGLRGDAKANALMKAITKAKRRLTLSMVGLGMLDESEVETIPAAILHSTSDVQVDLETGEVFRDVTQEVVETAAPAETSPPVSGPTRRQMRDIKALADNLSMDAAELRAYAQALTGKASATDLTSAEADTLIESLTAMANEQGIGPNPAA
jgi:hypothetical protein